MPLSTETSHSQAALDHCLEGAFKQRLKQSLLAHEFDTWFGPTRLTENQGRAVLLVPNHFYAEWIKDRYLGQAQEALDTAAGKSTNLYFDLDPALARVEPRAAAAQAAVTETPQAVLNRRYNFANFVVGPCNELAHAACRAVAEQPGRQYNPLFIFGGGGPWQNPPSGGGGKLHPGTLPRDVGALQHLRGFHQRTHPRGCALTASTPSRPSSGNWTACFWTTSSFWPAGSATQEELFHTFNNIFEAGKQIIVTSDKMPREIPGLEKRLRTRFEWGLLADLQPPDEGNQSRHNSEKSLGKGPQHPQGRGLFHGQPAGHQRPGAGRLPEPAGGGEPPEKPGNHQGSGQKRAGPHGGAAAR